MAYRYKEDQKVTARAKYKGQEGVNHVNISYSITWKLLKTK